jgi:hypothetical protein
MRRPARFFAVEARSATGRGGERIVGSQLRLRSVDLRSITAVRGNHERRLEMYKGWRVFRAEVATAPLESPGVTDVDIAYVAFGTKTLSSSKVTSARTIRCARGRRLTRLTLSHGVTTTARSTKVRRNSSSRSRILARRIWRSPSCGNERDPRGP